MRSKPMRFVIVGAVCVALMWVGLVMAQEGAGLPITFVKYFTGTIDGKYSIEMILSRSGSQLNGRYYYVGQEKDLKLYGHMDSAGNLFLEESGEGGKTTGLFRGKFVTGSRVQGKWIRPDGTQSLGFVLEENFAPSPRWDAWKAEQEAVEDFPAEVSLLGTIDGTLPIHMRLSIKNGNVTGSYYYDNRKKDIPLTGTVKGGVMLLTEYGEPGKVTGRLEGNLSAKAADVEGYWISPDESRLLPLYMEVQESPGAYGSPWEGDWSWVYNTSTDATWYTISEVTDKGFKFSASGISGANVGEVEGYAEFRGPDLAVWDDKEEESWRDESSIFTFRLKDGLLSIETENGSYYGGMGVGFMGEYRKDGLRKRQLTLKQRGIFKTEKEEQAFIKTVGPDTYFSFLEVFQMGDEPYDCDGFGAYVRRGYVRGLRTDYEGMIMVTPDGKVWAGYLFLDTIYYYTNVPAYATRLPKTMKDWQEECEVTRVLYMSAGI